jgi:hypothetical protein
MSFLNDPRLRRALDQISQNFEVATESAQEGLYSFHQAYLHPCFTSTGDCLRSCTAPCFSGDEDRRRRQRGQATSRGRAEFSFDFYDDWEENETDALLGLGDDEGDSSQPRRERQMDYGTRQGGHLVPAGLEEEGTKNIPSSSYFGFMDRLPFKIGAKGLKYQPSIADLQDHPNSRYRETEEEQPLLAESGSEDERLPKKKPKRRLRSGTHGSGHTTDSFSSRGDIFPSEDEMDDAVPLDDEFELALERRTTGHATDDGGSGEVRTSGTRSSSHLSIATTSSGGSTKRVKRKPATIENYPAAQSPSEANSKALFDDREARQETTTTPQAHYSQQITMQQSVTPSFDGTRKTSKSESIQSSELSRPSSSHLPVPEEAPVTSSSATPSLNTPTVEPFNAAALPHFA